MSDSMRSRTTGANNEGTGVAVHGGTKVGRVTVFALFTAAYFMSYFYRSANAVIAPDLSREMALGAAQLGLMTSLFYAAFAAAQIPLGFGLDRWGPRWVTPGLMLVGAGGSLVFGSALSFRGLALGRALIGAGMAGVLMGSLKIFSQWFSAKQFATVSGLLVGIGSLGALFAATPMALLNSTFGWRSVFVMGAVLTTLIAVSIVVWTRNAPPGVSWNDDLGSRGGLRQVFADRRMWRIIPLTFFMAGTILGFHGLWSGPYLYDVHGFSDVQVGNAILLLGIGSTLGFLSSGWLADRFGLIRVIVVMGGLFAMTQYGLAAIPSASLTTLLYFVFGYAGAYNVMLLAQARYIFPLNMTGTAVTSVNLFAIGGTFLLQWCMGLIIGLFPASAAGQYPAHAYSAALLFTATGTLLALVWYLPLVRMVDSAPLSTPPV
ncbi:MAG: MFS transporter [Caldilineaceae bacterium]